MCRSTSTESRSNQPLVPYVIALSVSESFSSFDNRDVNPRSCISNVPKRHSSQAGPTPRKNRPPRPALLLVQAVTRFQTSSHSDLWPRTSLESTANHTRSRSRHQLASHKMSSAASVLRFAARSSLAPRAFRPVAARRVPCLAIKQQQQNTRAFSVSPRQCAAADHDAHDPHHEESFEEFTAR